MGNCIKPDPQELASCTGYWLHFNSSKRVSMTGTRIESCSMDLEEGWNLVGGPSCEVSIHSVQDPGNLINPNNLYDRINEEWVQTDKLKPGHGYYLYAYDDGNVTFSCGSGKSSPAVASLREGAVKDQVASIDNLAEGEPYISSGQEVGELLFSNAAGLPRASTVWWWRF